MLKYYNYSYLPELMADTVLTFSGADLSGPNNIFVLDVLHVEISGSWARFSLLYFVIKI